MSLDKLYQKRIVSDVEVYPSFFRLVNENDKNKLAKLLNDNFIQVYDNIQEQIQELIKIRNPQRKLSTQELGFESNIHLGTTNLSDYGVWVYYPWSRHLVHLLDEPEFIEVRTNRNKNKITKQEQDSLSKKVVGVVGLSVGQSVCLTMAIERSFGEIRIADYDTLDLSNLNRIRSGVINIGVSKVAITAREIAEIDPFLKVTCYYEGITEGNIDQFMIKNKSLDLLIDECDNADIKLLCREKAKAFAIPVLMEASDRGTIDIERFDLDAHMMPFHGLVEDLTYEKMKTMNKEQKLPYLLRMAQFETLSQRMKSSLQDIGKTLVTWPQLASAVVLGGGVSADIARRIFLNQLTVSGRFYIDLEDLICNPSDLE